MRAAPATAAVAVAARFGTAVRIEWCAGGVGAVRLEWLPVLAARVAWGLRAVLRRRQGESGQENSLRFDLIRRPGGKA
jgi:hypothetical protein